MPEHPRTLNISNILKLTHPPHTIFGVIPYVAVIFSFFF